MAPMAPAADSAPPRRSQCRRSWAPWLVIYADQPCEPRAPGLGRRPDARAGWMPAERARALRRHAVEVDAVPARGWITEVGLEGHADKCGRRVAKGASRLARTQCATRSRQPHHLKHVSRAQGRLLQLLPHHKRKQRPKALLVVDAIERPRQKTCFDFCKYSRKFMFATSTMGMSQTAGILYFRVSS